MKYVGFLQHHDNCPMAEDLRALPSGPPSPEGREALAAVTRHQQRAALVFGWMHYVSDPQTGELIAPHGYYTDGQWVWPAYLPHYADFVAHARDCRAVSVSKNALVTIEEELSHLL